MNSPALLKHPNAFLPVAMSLGAVATVMVFIALHGTAPQADEGAAAHIWQLPHGCPGASRDVLRDQVGAEIAETSCGDLGSSGWCCSGGYGAGLAAPLVDMMWPGSTRFQSQREK